MTDNQSGDPVTRPELNALGNLCVAAVKECRQDLSRGTLSSLTFDKHAFTPVRPLALEEADHEAASIGADAVDTAVAAPADMHPNLVRMLELEQRDAKMFERVRPYGFGKPPLDLPDVARPSALSLLGMVKQPVHGHVRIEIKFRHRPNPAICGPAQE